ncbi:hypothetical protein J132_02995 [Termitomyces sp. J132]|nr:hypothetical protein J132_02995 [Termitomyces sp. J132]
MEESSLTYHLSSDAEHTVYEGEVVGFTLSLHLLALVVAAKNLHRKVDWLSHMPERHAVLRAGKKWTAHTRSATDLQVHWTSGHIGFGPNVRVDELAKDATQGTSSNPKTLPVYLQSKPLPASIPATRQCMLTNIEGLWQRRWKKSSRFLKINRINDTLPSKGYMHLVQDLDCKQSAILTQFRMGHVPLN